MRVIDYSQVTIDVLALNRLPAVVFADIFQHEVLCWWVKLNKQSAWRHWLKVVELLGTSNSASTRESIRQELHFIFIILESCVTELDAFNFWAAKQVKSIGVSIWSAWGRWRLLRATNRFTVPPTPSQGPFPWLVEKKFHSALEPKSSSWWQRLMKFLQFLYCPINIHTYHPPWLESYLMEWKLSTIIFHPWKKYASSKTCKKINETFKS